MKVSPSWRLSGLLEEFGALLRPNLSIIPSHVKRDANSVADCLENEGVTTERESIYWETHISKAQISQPGVKTCQQGLPNPGWGAT
jgi:hypothetical protein